MQFKGLRKPITTILMLSMTIPLTFGTPTPPASAGVIGVGIGGLIAAVTTVVAILVGKDDSNDKKAEFTQRLMAEMSRRNPDSNFVISHEPGKIEGDYYHDHVELDLKDPAGTFGYEVYESPKGQPFRFERVGDGGYISWAYSGDFNRESDKVITAKEN